MYFFVSFQIVLLIIFVTFTVWINAKEIRDDQWNDNISHSNKTHWYNCTINGTVYYDDDCVGWIGKMLFYMGKKLLWNLHKNWTIFHFRRCHFYDCSALLLLLLLLRVLTLQNLLLQWETPRSYLRNLCLSFDIQYTLLSNGVNCKLLIKS